MLFRLREILLSKNITFSSFAARLDMPPASLAVTEKFCPALATMQRYADELKMPVWELVYDCGVPTNEPYIRPDNDSQIDDRVIARMQALLIEKHMNMRKLAIAMDITQQSLGQAIKRKKLTLKTVEKMAAGLGVEPWELFATPEEVRGEVLRRKAALGIEEEPDPAAAVAPETHKPASGAYVVLPTLANGLVDLSQVVMIDTPEGKVAALPMSAVRIMESESEEGRGKSEEEEEEDDMVLELMGDR